MLTDFESLYMRLIETELLQEGTVGAALYAQAYDIRTRLGERLQTDADDPDIVRLVELHEAIQKLLCQRTASYVRGE